MATSIQSGAVYRIISKASSNLGLELSNGTPDNGTQAQGWQEMTDTNFYNQVWLVESTAGQYWTLRNLRSGTYLDLSNGSSSNGAKMQGWAGLDTDNQKWAIIQNGQYWMIRNKGTETAVDLSAGGQTNGTKVQGWQYDTGNNNQQWSFIRMTRTPQEIQQLLAAHPRVAGVQFPNYADVNYLVLPVNLMNNIYADSGIEQTFHWRSEIFDCDDFAFTFKAALAKHGNDWVRADGVAILCGLMYGSKPGAGHALNWSVTDNLNGIEFLEPQNGTWDANAFGWQAYFGVF